MLTEFDRFGIISRINLFVSGVSAPSPPSCTPRSLGTELLASSVESPLLEKSFVAPTPFSSSRFA